jgi:hypothetical protein
MFMQISVWVTSLPTYTSTINISYPHDMTTQFPKKEEGFVSFFIVICLKLWNQMSECKRWNLRDCNHIKF